MRSNPVDAAQLANTPPAKCVNPRATTPTKRHNWQSTATHTPHTQMAALPTGASHEPLQHSNAIAAGKLTFHTRRYYNNTNRHVNNASHPLRTRSDTIPLHDKATRERTQLHDHCELQKRPFTHTCTANADLQMCQASKNTVGDPAAVLTTLFHARHCQRPQRNNQGDSAHATSHTLSSNTSIAVAAMPWRSGNKQQQAIPWTKMTYASHHDGRVPPCNTPLHTRHHDHPK